MANVGGRTMPVSVCGDYYNYPGRRELSVHLACRAVAKCRFGDAVYDVWICDGDCNLHFGDMPRLKLEGDRVVVPSPAAHGGTLSLVKIGDDRVVVPQRTPLAQGGPPPQGDTLVVIDSQGNTLVKTLFGMPVLVDGRYYNVRISKDGSTISAEPADVRTGMVKAAHETWRVMLVGADGAMVVRGGAEPVPVPVGRYAMIGYTQTAPFDGPVLPEVKIVPFSVFYNEKAPSKLFDVTEGQTTELAFGSPLTAKATVTKAGSAVQFGLETSDANGRAIDNLTAIRGKTVGMPAQPKLQVVDDTGKIIYKCTLEYG
jgi:hypothetical protein